MRIVLVLFLFAVAILTLSISCKKKDSGNAPVSVVAKPMFSITPDSLKFTTEGGNIIITDSMNGSRWDASSNQSWCTLSAHNSISAVSQLTITASANPTINTRTATLTFVMDSKTVLYVFVTQMGRATLYPSYKDSIAPDPTGMSNTSVQLAAKMKLGWNIGNTMEAPGGETGWGNPQISENYIKFVKQSGFNAIRIPCAWYLHMDNASNAHIDTNWLNRVKQVVQYCVNNDIYVLLNIHWDGGWLDCTAAKKDSVNSMQKAFWEQIAKTMRDFDEHLIFASANEPDTHNAAAQMDVLLSYHQTFVNAVRSTGGRNTYRSLVIQGDNQLISVNAFPTDPTPNRMMYEDHNYTPYQFCLMGDDASWGKMFYYWGAGHHSMIEPDRNPNWDCEENAQTLYFQGIKAKFIDKGIPVLLGEYGAYRRGGTAHVPKDLAAHNDAVDYWITFTTKAAIANGIKPFFWDTGGILDRRNNTIFDQRTITSIIAGSK